MEQFVCFGLRPEICSYRVKTKQRVGDQVESWCVKEANAISLHFQETSLAPRASPGFKGRPVLNAQSLDLTSDPHVGV